MTTPEQRWDGPIQDAIRDWDEQQGHTALLARTCCNPRPWQPICVDCPGRFASSRKGTDQ